MNPVLSLKILYIGHDKERQRWGTRALLRRYNNNNNKRTIFGANNDKSEQQNACMPNAILISYTSVICGGLTKVY